jgi:3-oxoacyl-(acyl-carrier-protein) synthase
MYHWRPVKVPRMAAMRSCLAAMDRIWAGMWPSQQALGALGAVMSWCPLVDQTPKLECLVACVWTRLMRQCQGAWLSTQVQGAHEAVPSEPLRVRAPQRPVVSSSRRAHQQEVLQVQCKSRLGVRLWPRQEKSIWQPVRVEAAVMSSWRLVLRQDQREVTLLLQLAMRSAAQAVPPRSRQETHPRMLEVRPSSLLGAVSKAVMPLCWGVTELKQEEW